MKNGQRSKFMGGSRYRAGMIAVAALASWTLAGTTWISAESCLSQAHMSAETRSGLASAGFALASEVKDGNVAKLQSNAIVEYASNFSAAGALVSDTAEKLGGDTLKVTQVYQLDARSRKPDETTDADFSCPLAGAASETDFSISGLPPGLYGFVMVEAAGVRPWLLSFLVRQEQGGWKLAGFYPHARLAAGHDGLWYWNAARDDVKAKQPWLAWLMYGQADELLRPAAFASSTNLDKLRAEQRAAAPPELEDGIGPAAPLVIKTANGDANAAEYRFTGIASQGSDDGKRLNLVLHLQVDSSPAEASAMMARNNAAARALLNAHKELRQGFDGVIVTAEQAGHEPFVTEQRTSELH